MHRRKRMPPANHRVPCWVIIKDPYSSFLSDFKSNPIIILNFFLFLTEPDIGQSEYATLFHLALALEVKHIYRYRLNDIRWRQSSRLVKYLKYGALIIRYPIGQFSALLLSMVGVEELLSAAIFQNREPDLVDTLVHMLVLLIDMQVLRNAFSGHLKMSYW